jgi:enoyl-CoA hydratase/carnithine racemase
MSEQSQKSAEQISYEAKKAQQEARRLAREAAEKYAVRLGPMTDRQLKGELRRARKAPGLDGALAAALLIVMNDTKTDTNPKGRLHCYPV